MTPAIRTVSGVLVDLVDPQPDQIRLDDIAHSLAVIPRYIGHTPRPYSVAEHSIAVRRCVSEILRKLAIPPHEAIRVERAALLHDAAEAYTGDLASPIKRWVNSMSDGAWTRLERGLDDAIAVRYGLDDEARTHPIIHTVDTGPVFAAECHAFGRPAADCPANTAPWPRFRAHYWPPDIAATRFRVECDMLGVCDLY